MSEHYCWATLSLATTINGEKMENKKFEMLDSEYKKSLNELCHYDDNVVEKCLQLRLRNKPIENLLSENVRSDEPQRMVKICEYMENGYMHFGSEVKDNFIYITSGHLCDYLQPHLTECLSEKKCTYNVTKDNFILQTGYNCLTCHPDTKAYSICQSCAEICHLRHELIPVNSHLYCDCYLENCQCK